MYRAGQRAQARAKTNSGLLKSCQGSRVIITNNDAAKFTRLKQQKGASQPRDRVYAIAALTVAEEEGATRRRHWKSANQTSNGEKRRQGECFDLLLYLVFLAERGAETADQQHGLNVCYVRTCSEKVFPSPVEWKFRQPQARVETFCETEDIFFIICRFHQPLLLGYVKYVEGNAANVRREHDCLTEQWLKWTFPVFKG